MNEQTAMDLLRESSVFTLSRCRGMIRSYYGRRQSQKGRLTISEPFVSGGLH